MTGPAMKGGTSGGGVVQRMTNTMPNPSCEEAKKGDEVEDSASRFAGGLDTHVAAVATTTMACYSFATPLLV
uniref:Uncharacterized protein n=1 Tax=Oryza meridionalis TaxID=40149 RepID=A0A0E0FBL1_9ORYZ